LRLHLGADRFPTIDRQSGPASDGMKPPSTIPLFAIADRRLREEGHRCHGRKDEETKAAAVAGPWVRSFTAAAVVEEVSRPPPRLANKYPIGRREEVPDRHINPGDEVKTMAGKRSHSVDVEDVVAL